MSAPTPLQWTCRDRTVSFDRTLIMGVINVTPDSFSDGGRHLDRPQAIAHGRRLAGEGADLLDIGGESSRPGSVPVEEAEELRRVLPVVEALAGETPCLISVDTTKSGVARRALEAGAHIINDVSAMTFDPAMASVAAGHGAGVVLMHMQGAPATMQQNPTYQDVADEVRAYLRRRVEAAQQAGLPWSCVAVDPGFGFGKTVEHNVRLLVELHVLAALGRPVVAGLSRKSFLGHLTGRAVSERQPASLAAMACAILQGAHIIRAHDVKESCDVARIVDMYKREDARRGMAEPHHGP
jgi:dihydropteroate synthase